MRGVGAACLGLARCCGMKEYSNHCHRRVVSCTCEYCTPAVFEKVMLSATYSTPKRSDSEAASSANRPNSTTFMPPMFCADENFTPSNLSSCIWARYSAIVGYAVLIAANGNDGLGKARNKRPDVVVSHLMMPCDGRHDIRRRLGVRPSVTRYSGGPQFCRRGAAARCVCQRVSKDGQEGRTGY